MAYHQPGDLGMLTYRAEATPGVIQTGSRSWGGITVKLGNERDDQLEFIILPEDRGYGATSKGPTKNGCTIDFHCRAGGSYGDWRDFWAKYVLGDRTGPTATLPTFTLIVYVKSATKYEVYTGCKVNKGVISGTKPGAILEFSMQIFAQDHAIESGNAPPSTFNITDIQNVTVGAAPSEPTESPLFWAQNLKVNYAGGGLATEYFQKWSATIDNHLIRDDGIKTWYDNTTHAQSIALFEEEREIIFEGTVKLKGATNDYFKIAGSNVVVSIPIDDDWMSLSGGIIVPNNFRDLSQKAGEENLTMRFPTNKVTFA